MRPACEVCGKGAAETLVVQVGGCTFLLHLCRGCGGWIGWGRRWTPILSAVATLQERRPPSTFTSEGPGDGVRTPGLPPPASFASETSPGARVLNLGAETARAPRFLNGSGSAFRGRPGWSWGSAWSAFHG